MLIRISLIIAIIAGLAVGALNFTQVKEKITKLQGDLKTENETRKLREKDLASTRTELKKTGDELKSTKEVLKVTTGERDKAVLEVAAQTKRAEKLTDELAKTKQERDSAQQDLNAYAIIGLNPAQVLNLKNSYKGLEDRLSATEGENKILFQRVKVLDNELAVYKTKEYHVPLPATLKGKVLVTDPKWNFVVLNVGLDQGVLEHGELLVNRDGRLVAKVKVSSVQKDRCIANIVPGWALGDVVEGDLVIPAYPAS